MLLGSFSQQSQAGFYLAAISNAAFYAGSIVERTPDLCHQPGLAPAAPAVPAAYRALHL